jgi:hypothetical protein
LAEHVKEVAVVASTMDLVGWLRKHLEAADTDVLQESQTCSTVVRPAASCQAIHSAQARSAAV